MKNSLEVKTNNPVFDDDYHFEKISCSKKNLTKSALTPP